MKELTQEEASKPSGNPRLFNGTSWFEFETIEEHAQYIESITPAPTIDYKYLVKMRKQRGNEVMEEYLADNAAINLTFEQSVQQLEKFQVVKQFLEVGNIEDSINIISATPTDDIFTEQRKQKYLTLLGEDL